MSGNDLHFRVAANKVFAGCLVAFVTLFGIGFTISGLDMQSYAAFWEWGGTIALGLALLLLAERVWRYFFLPQVSITSDAMTLRPFLWRTKHWTFADTKSWAVAEHRIERNWRGMQLPVPLTVEHLIRTDINGRVHRAVLPGFAGQNGTLLQELENRSGKPIRLAVHPATQDET